MTKKSANDMTDEEFSVAVKNRVWRGQQAPPADPAAVAEARRRGWPATPEAFADAAKLLADAGSPNNTSSTARQPEPLKIGNAATRAATLAMSDREFDCAVRSRAWAH